MIIIIKYLSILILVIISYTVTVNVEIIRKNVRNYLNIAKKILAMRNYIFQILN